MFDLRVCFLRVLGWRVQLHLQVLQILLILFFIFVPHFALVLFYFYFIFTGTIDEDVVPHPALASPGASPIRAADDPRSESSSPENNFYCYTSQEVEQGVMASSGGDLDDNKGISPEDSRQVSPVSYVTKNGKKKKKHTPRCEVSSSNIIPYNTRSLKRQHHVL